MTDESQNAATEHAKQAAGQGKAAARNAGKALRTVAEPAMEAVAEEARDTAQKLEGTAEDAVNVARRVDPRVLSRISGDTGVGFLALSVSLYAGAVAFAKFRQAYSGRSHITS